MTRKTTKVQPISGEREKHLLTVCAYWKKRALAAERGLFRITPHAKKKGKANG